jgi:hypothetical protein
MEVQVIQTLLHEVALVVKVVAPQQTVLTELLLLAGRLILMPVMERMALEMLQLELLEIFQVVEVVVEMPVVTLIGLAVVILPV